ncbi:MAG: DinB family protein [Desulfobacteraceae bacterium]|jgi:hypothetical protein
MGEVFEDRNLTGAVFHRVNLGEVLFNDVNLGGAEFDNVNLGEVKIRNANLSNLSIDGASIDGMTIYGIRVDELIWAELDRRDPERVRLRMQDPHDPESVWVVMERLEQVRREFREMLRATPAKVLVTQPGEGKWSAIEHVRHLVFVEEVYLNRWIIRNDQPLSKLGILPVFLADDPQYVDVGSEPTDDLETILAAWDTIHASTRKFLADLTPETLRQDTSDVDLGQGTVGHVLQGMAQHDLQHIREVEAAIAKIEGE